MKINTINQNFKGFSNPISNTFYTTNGIVHTLSVQLDNIETDDLNQYRDLKKILDFPKEEIYGDVLTITYANMPNNKRFFINDKPILTGIDMARLNDYTFASKDAKSEYKKEEKMLVKLYTFLAKVTKTLMNKETLAIDDSMSYVTQEAFSNLCAVLDNKRTAMSIIMDAKEYPKPFQHNSGRINKFIEKSMGVLLG